MWASAGLRSCGAKEVTMTCVERTLVGRVRMEIDGEGCNVIEKAVKRACMEREVYKSSVQGKD